MNKTEHLLTCLMEECAEIQQAAAKALRFGLDDGYLGSGTTNADDIVKEYSDLKAVIQMLSEQDNRIFLETVDLQLKAKKEKVTKYMEYAENRGTLRC